MSGSSRAATALLVLAASAVPLAAQTNSFNAGAQVNSPALTGYSTTGSLMIGMALTLDVAGGGTLNTSWADLGGGVCGGSFANGFTVTLGCGTDTYGGSWQVNNNTNTRIRSLRFNGAPGRTLFDCGWNGTSCNNTGTGGPEGTPGSANGWSLTSVAGFGGSVLGFYSNAVSLGGNAPVGDLYEELTIQWVGDLGAGDTYSFNADTDNSDLDSPPPTVVPEPSTYALMASGLVGIGFMARRRRKV